MLDHVHVLRVEQVAAVLIFLQLVVLAGAFFLHELVAPAAALRAVARERAAAGGVVAYQTAPGICHAHGAVDEGLKFETSWQLRAHGCYVCKRELARTYDAFGAQLMPHERCLRIGDTCLRAHVDVEFWRYFARYAQGAQVADYDGVYTCVL